MAFPRWWLDPRFMETTDSLSIIDLVKNGTVDYRLAGMLWFLMEHRASLLVAAGPSYAGKTTLLHALLDFLRPEIQQVNLQGYYEDFQFQNCCKPANTYLVTEEISNHMYEYLWGYQVIKAFKLLARGFALGGTIHARTAKETVYLLREKIGLPFDMIARLSIIVTLRALPGKTWEDEPIRRVETVSLINLVQEGLTVRLLAARYSPEEELQYPAEEVLQESIFQKLAIKNGRLSDEIAVREKYLRQLGSENIHSHDQVRQAIVKFYEKSIM